MVEPRHRGGDGVVDPADDERRRRQWYEIGARGTAALADCGVSLRAGGLRNDAERWDHLFTRLLGPTAAGTHDPAAVTALLRRGYRPNTEASYMSKFRAFARYCIDHGRETLPADPSTVVGYVLHELL